MDTDEFVPCFSRTNRLTFVDASIGGIGIYMATFAFLMDKQYKRANLKVRA